MRSGTAGTFFAGLASTAAFWIGLVLLAFAPVIRGGNRHMALVLLEWLALALLLVLAWRCLFLDDVRTVVRPASTTPVSKIVLILALSPIWVAVVQLVPVPPAVWGSLPGRELYSQALSAVQMPSDTWRPLSLMPDATWLSVLAALPIVAIFGLAYLATERQLALLVRAIVVFAFAQAIFGLVQIGSGRELYFEALAYNRAIGTFANPNHFANYLAMTLPLTILVFRQALQARPARGYRSGGRASSAGGSMDAALWGSILFVLLAALLASLSKAGITVGIVIGLSATMLLPLQELSRRAWWVRVAGVLTLCVLVVAAVGLDGLAGRLSESVLDRSRWLMIKGSWQAVLAYWPVGTGLGSFAGVFPRFQPAEFSGFAGHAHSDFIQLLMEGGLLFVVFAGMTLWLLVLRVVAIAGRLRADPSDQLAVMLASCGLGLLAILLHSWVDFNLRIPSNAILAAFLLGVFLRPLARKR